MRSDEVLKCEEVSDNRNSKKLSKTVEARRFFNDSIVNFDRIDGESGMLKKLKNRVTGKKPEVCFVMNSTFSVGPMSFEYEMIQSIDVPDVWDGSNDSSFGFEIMCRSAQNGPRID